jgi:hypothetical protein
MNFWQRVQDWIHLRPPSDSTRTFIKAMRPPGPPTAEDGKDVFTPHLFLCRSGWTQGQWGIDGPLARGLGNQLRYLGVRSDWLDEYDQARIEVHPVRFVKFLPPLDQ